MNIHDSVAWKDEIDTVVMQSHMVLYLLEAKVLHLKSEIIRSLVWSMDDDYFYHPDNMETSLQSLKNCADTLIEKLKEVIEMDDKGSDAV